MKAKEGIVQNGPGVSYKPTVSVRSDKVAHKGDMQMQGTQAAFAKCHNDSKKA